MANLTIAVDDDLLRRARIRALETGTSVNAFLREYLQDLPVLTHLPPSRCSRWLALETAVGGLVEFDRDEFHGR